ncbi:MAG: regulatory iron-sulfur-containing complex subunit RicT [Bacteroidales bacterium]
MENKENRHVIYTNPFFTRGFRKEPDPKAPSTNFAHGCAKLDVYDWMKGREQPPGLNRPRIAEVRFKNSKKDFFRVPDNMQLTIGDVVAVESNPGHDIGIVTLTGELAWIQLKKKKYRGSIEEMKKVYRHARPLDVEKWIRTVSREDDTMFRTRKIASGLGLDMKVNDVEYQGDGTKAIFYYTADDRVDFRQLIKALAEEFRVRIEMKQIGARQEAARLGGIGSCGRELCCSTWMTNFKSVSTNYARNQQLSLNPSKLAGQCGKLKCCLRYENDTYLEALKDFPPETLVLETKKGDAGFRKADVFKRILWYSYQGDFVSMMAIPLDKVWEIMDMNKRGKKPEQLEDFAITVGQDTGTDDNGEASDSFYKFDED